MSLTISRLSLPDIKTIGTWRSLSLFIPSHPPSLTPGNIPGTQFCYRLSRWVEPRAIVRVEGLYYDTIGNRASYSLVYNALPQPTASPSATAWRGRHVFILLNFTFRYELSWSAVLMILFNVLRRSRLPGCLSRVTAVSRLLGLQVRIPPLAWMSVCCECCVSSGRGLCDEAFARPEVSYRVSRVKLRSWNRDNEYVLAH